MAKFYLVSYLEQAQRFFAIKSRVQADETMMQQLQRWCDIVLVVLVFVVLLVVVALSLFLFVLVMRHDVVVAVSFDGCLFSSSSSSRERGDERKGFMLKIESDPLPPKRSHAHTNHDTNNAAARPSDS